MRKQFYKTGEFNPSVQRVEIVQGLYLCWSLHIDEEGNSYLVTTFEVIKLDTATIYEPESGNIIVIKKDDDIINESHHTLGKVVRVGDIISETTIKGFSCSVFFIPSDEVLVTLTDYNSVSGALKIKGDNYDINKM